MAKRATRAPAIAVVNYDAGWDVVNNRGDIELTLQTGKPFVMKGIDTHLEFIALLTLLQGEKTVFARAPGYITTKP